MRDKEQPPKPESDETKEDFAPKDDDYPRTLAELLEKFKKKKKEN